MPPAPPSTSPALPLIETHAPSELPGVVETIRAAAVTSTPVYPIGGATALDYGLPAREPGVGLLLTGLNRVIDYPARDLTVTVEAGLTVAELAATLAAQGQRLPVDVSQSETATLGGAIATNASGPRRYGHGTLRDYVIGIQAVDGRGMMFQGGGRVVKNVAGYDFCKLLTGSLGTLAVITQLTLKVKPQAPATSLLLFPLGSRETAETALASIVVSGTTPVAVELLIGPTWTDELKVAPGAYGLLAIGFEGTAVEVDWLQRTMAEEMAAIGLASPRILRGADGDGAWHQLSQFPATATGPLTLKATVPPSGVTELVDGVQKIDPQVTVAAHAGNGVVNVSFADFSAAAVSQALIGQLQPATMRRGGNIVVLASRIGELTRQAVWGGASEAAPLMRSVKEQFDPQNILNRGRFLY